MLGEWSNPGRVAEYLSGEIPNRDAAEELLLEALPHMVKRVLDLGTGDGRLLALVRSAHPEAQAVGIDSSPPMFARAAERFGSDGRVELVVHDLRQLLAVSGPLTRSSQDWRFITSRIRASAPCSVRSTRCSHRVASSPTSTSSPLRPPATRALPPGDRARRGRSRGSSRRPVQATGLAARRRLSGVDCRFKWMELALILAVRPGRE
jgi:tRNA (cmo5U34)-methyltransferase